jgi:hypothetical protein
MQRMKGKFEIFYVVAMVQLQQRPERMDVPSAQRVGFEDHADFFCHFQRLSEIIVRSTGPHAGADATVGWVNPQGKYPLPGKVRIALYRSQGV